MVTDKHINEWINFKENDNRFNGFFWNMYDVFQTDEKKVNTKNTS